MPPKSPKSRELTDMIKVRCRLEDKIRYRKLARKHGRKTLSGFVRDVLEAIEADAKALLQTDEDRDRLYQLHNQVKLAGRNLNMVAMRVNLLATTPMVSKKWQEDFGLNSETMITDIREVLVQQERVLGRIDYFLAKDGSA